jgi:SAM-dependent methyltransferase
LSAENEKVSAALVQGYGAVAGAYAERFGGELEHKPFDRALLDEIAAAADGPVLDLGCGPGHVARYLHDRGAMVTGIDLAPGMIAEARRLNPHMKFLVADVRELPVPDSSAAAVVALYCLIHLPADQLVVAFTEIRRVLGEGGRVLASFHRGRGVRHVSEFLGSTVSLDFHFYEPEDIETATQDAGLTIERIENRRPYDEVEAQTERFYILAARPATHDNRGPA